MSSAIEVGLGLAFMYFVFASLCSGVSEAIARLLNSRGKALFSAVNALIGDAELAQKFWDDELVRSLAKAKAPRSPSGEPKAKEVGAAGRPVEKAAAIWPHDRTASLFTASRTEGGGTVQQRVAGAQARALPSYIPPETFATALVHAYKSEAASHAPARSVAVADPESAVNRVMAAAVALANAPAPAAAAAPGSGSGAGGAGGALGLDVIDAHLQPVVAHLATWFNNAMDRLSGMYKRRVQLVVLGLSVLAVGAFNLNTVHVAQQLWREPALRAQISSTAAAATTATGGTAPCPAGATGGSGSLACAVAEAQSLPVGWSEANRPAGVLDTDGWLWAVVGWLLSLVALSLGAPFWFSVMTKLSSLRSTGPPPPATAAA